jgi:hypothetical protein
MQGQIPADSYRCNSYLYSLKTELVIWAFHFQYWQQAPYNVLDFKRGKTWHNVLEIFRKLFTIQGFYSKFQILKAKIKIAFASAAADSGRFLPLQFLFVLSKNWVSNLSISFPVLTASSLQPVRL